MPKCVSLRPHGTTRLSPDGFLWNLMFVYFSKSVEKIQVSLKMTRLMGILHEDICPFMIIPRWIIFGMRNISGRSHRQNQNTHFIFNKFFRKPCCLWNNVDQYGRAGQATDDNMIRSMLFLCWMPKAHNMQYLSPLHCKKSYTNASQCYAKRILPVLICCNFVLNIYFGPTTLTL